VGNIEEAALKGRRYTRKKKKEAGLKSRPYTVWVEVEIEEAGFPPRRAGGKQALQGQNREKASDVSSPIARETGGVAATGGIRREAKCRFRTRRKTTSWE
jgi:hypothetical protein